MIEPTDEDWAEFARLVKFAGDLDLTRSDPEMFSACHAFARTIAKLRIAVGALAKVAKDRGGFMGEYHAECQAIATDALHQIKGQSNEQAD